jgi:hypothetical protein
MIVPDFDTCRRLRCPHLHEDSLFQRKVCWLKAEQINRVMFGPERVDALDAEREMEKDFGCPFSLERFFLEKR